AADPLIQRPPIQGAGGGAPLGHPRPGRDQRNSSPRGLAPFRLGGGIGPARPVTPRGGPAQMKSRTNERGRGAPRRARHTAATAQDADVVDALTTARGVAGDQGVLAATGAAPPVQPPSHAQTGFVETWPPRTRRYDL